MTILAKAHQCQCKRETPHLLLLKVQNKRRPKKSLQGSVSQRPFQIPLFVTHELEELNI